MFIASLVAAIFMALALLHVYWALGGQWGSVAALVVLHAGLLGVTVEHDLLRWAIVCVAAAMMARAIGDFRLVGFFKEITGSRFAKLDTLFFSPLCLALGLGLSAVAAV